MPFRWKAAIGFLLAPVASLAAAAIWIILSSLIGVGPMTPSSLRTTFQGLDELKGAIAGVAALMTGLVGVPAFLWHRRRRSLTLKRVLCAGAIIGAAPLVLAYSGGVVVAVWRALSWGWQNPMYGLTAQLRELFHGGAQGAWWLLLFVFCGSFSSVVFWFVVLREKDPRPAEGPRHAIDAA